MTWHLHCFEFALHYIALYCIELHCICIVLKWRCIVYICFKMYFLQLKKNDRFHQKNSSVTLLALDCAPVEIDTDHI